MSKPLWIATGVLAGTFAVLKAIEWNEQRDLEAYKKKIAADAIRVIQENLTQPIVKV